MDTHIGIRGIFGNPCTDMLWIFGPRGIPGCLKTLVGICPQIYLNYFFFAVLILKKNVRTFSSDPLKRRDLNLKETTNPTIFTIIHFSLFPQLPQLYEIARKKPIARQNPNYLPGCGREEDFLGFM